MKSLIILGLFVFGLCFINTVYAGGEGDAPKKEKKERKPLEEMTITGTITKIEKKGKGDKVSIRYVLTDETGNKIRLPKPRKPRKKKGKEGEAAPEAAPDAINLADFVDAKVTVVGQGYTKEKKGKKSIYLKKIVKIDKAAE